MRAGKLDKRILIQSPPTGQDEETGEPLTVWADFVTDTPDHKVWASITDVSGREFLAAEVGQNQVQTKIGIRYRAGVLPSMRVVHGATTYNIEAVLGQDLKTLLLMCSRLS